MGTMWNLSEGELPTMLLKPADCQSALLYGLLELLGKHLKVCIPQQEAGKRWESPLSESINKGDLSPS